MIPRETVKFLRCGLFLALWVALTPFLVGTALNAQQPTSAAPTVTAAAVPNHVALVDMEMLILPGTQRYLEQSIARAASEGAAVIVVRLHTPGGLLTAAQNMVQAIFSSPVPVLVYVAPSGGAAISAGVFITMAAHVAAMAPSTTIGAAHPVSGEGSDIEGDMREKVTNMTAAMVRTIAERRGRNTTWAEEAVKTSSSLTEKEAVEQRVVDYIAQDINELLRKAAGREIEVNGGKVTLGEYGALPRVQYVMSLSDSVINFLANPAVLAILWLLATTGISIELYNFGGIVPGAIGVIALIVALAMSQVIPVSEGAVLLMALGGLLIGAELYVASGLLGAFGAVALALGALYLIDVTEAPGMEQGALWVVLPVVGTLALGTMLFSVLSYRVMRLRPQTGRQGMIGLRGRALETFSGEGAVSVSGEIWRATASVGVIEKGDAVVIVGMNEGLSVQVQKVEG